MASELKPCQIADALEKCGWAGASIGNKMIVLSAIEALRNTRPAPAATDTGLVTVLPLEWRKYRNGDAEAVTPFGEIYTAYVNGYWRITRNGKAGKFIKATGGDDVEAAKSGAQADFDANVLSLVRSQAEELLASKDADMDQVLADNRRCLVRITELEADNAAQAARIKELGDERYKLAYAITGGEDAPGYLDSLSVETLVEVARDNARRWFAEIDRAEALEAKLAAAEKALEFYANRENWKNGRFEQVDGGTVLRHYPASAHKDRGATARAVLGGKPS